MKNIAWVFPNSTWNLFEFRLKLQINNGWTQFGTGRSFCNTYEPPSLPPSLGRPMPSHRTCTPPRWGQLPTAPYIHNRYEFRQRCGLPWSLASHFGRILHPHPIWLLYMADDPTTSNAISSVFPLVAGPLSTPHFSIAFLTAFQCPCIQKCKDSYESTRTIFIGNTSKMKGQ